ncbi:helix-turn-helix domain-containing protein [Streptosporangium saharense]|uniref:helix-turn-helix domain-containing protein n=1 Tax=Streptosporangium saharense TaxID=1706840 RepID=UPI0036AF5C72
MRDRNTLELRPDMTIGERLRVARRSVEGLTQEILAERSGVNVDTIRKLEQNQRQSARISTINSLARALDLDTTALLLGVVPEEGARDPKVMAIRRALIPAAHFIPSAEADVEDTPPDVAALRRSVSDAWMIYHEGDLSALGEILPGLLAEARTAVREHTNGTALRARGVLSKTMQLGAHVMARNGMEDLALLALDRARQSARESNDPLLPAMIANSVSWIFIRTGRLDDSQNVALATADRVEPRFRTASPNEIAVYGGLLLSGTSAAARNERFDTARDLLAVARAAAQRSGEDSSNRWTSVFGPTAVAMQAVAVEAAAGEWGSVLRLAKRVPLTGQVPDSWKSWFLLDVAYAQAQTYRDADSVETLRALRGVAPAWLRQSGLSKVVIRELLARPHRPRGIVALADFVGVAH